MNSYSRIALLTTCGVAILLIGCREISRQEKSKVAGAKSPQSFNEVRKAAEHGDAKAQLALGDLYVRGEGVAQDSAEGIRWCRKAADQGNIQALKYLALLLGYDHAEVVRLHRKAADLGDAETQYLLGEDYYQGQGVPKDKEAATLWYRRAAEQGYLQAQIQLGEMYFFGEVPF
jgi:TPR repeat protein